MASSAAGEGQTPSPPSSSSTSTATLAGAQQSRPSKAPATLSEWQLLAILHRANLLQYYDVFLDKGGDDVNQIMCSDESEFLEIMSIVGMLSKPLHVRRLQRALAQYSNDPTAFNLAAIPQIGAPPVSAYPLGLGATDPVQLFNPASLSALTSVAVSTPSSMGPSASSSSSTLTTTASGLQLCTLSATIDAVAAPPGSSPGGTAVAAAAAAALGEQSTTQPSSPTPLARTPQQLAQLLGSIGGTANVLQGDYLQYLMENNQHTGGGGPSSPSPLHDDYVALGDFDPNSDTGEMPTLSDAQVARLTVCSQAAVAKLAPRPPKLVQNKKKVSADVLELMAMLPSDPKRVEQFRKFAAIYGRFDAKRKADKVLTLHEVSVNEAAAQICMLTPALLTRRDELFTLSRQVVKDAGYHYTKSAAASSGLPRSGSAADSRKRMKSETPTEGGAYSPRESQGSISPPLNVVDEDPVAPPQPSKRAKASPTSQSLPAGAAAKSLLDRWAAERIAKSSAPDAPGPSSSSSR